MRENYWKMYKDESLVTVIIPIYNMEKYIHRCLDSVIKQTYQNLEIILINDGSTDQCPEICDKYHVADSRIIVIHQKNMGVSVARNAALKIMQGEYVTFVDPDDYILPEYVETLVQMLKKNTADFAHCRNFRTAESKNNNTRCIIREITEMDFVKYHCHSAVWGHCYKSRVIRDNNILFDENIALGEDTLFNTLCYINSNKAYSTNLKLYYYGTESEGITRSRFCSKKLTAFYAIDQCLQAIGRKRRYLYRYYRQIEAVWALMYLVEIETNIRNGDDNPSFANFEKWERLLIGIMRKHMVPFCQKTDESIKMKGVYLVICLLGKRYFYVKPPKSSESKIDTDKENVV